MGTISRSVKPGGGTNINAGQTAVPNDVNTDMNTVYTEMNGLLDDENIETATIPGSKSFRFTGIAAPSSPGSGDVLLFASTTGVLTTKDSAGTTTALGAGRGEVTNLVVKPTTGSTAASVTITADAIDIEGNRATSVNVAASLASSGAGGLDTGAEAGDTTYYLWLIRKSSDGTVNGLFSASASAPTMPSGYDQKRLISHRRNDGSSNLILAYQSNDMVIGDYAAMQVASAITSSADLDLTSFVPVAIADLVMITTMQNATVQWELLDKDTATLQYAIADSNASVGGIKHSWARQNASGLITLSEVSGTATVSAWVHAWKVKVL